MKLHELSRLNPVHPEKELDADLDQVLVKHLDVDKKVKKHVPVVEYV